MKNECGVPVSADIVKKPNLLAEIRGITYTEAGEMVEIDTADQCRGIIQFTIDDDAVHSRMYGDVTVADLGSVLHMLRQIFTDGDYALAERVAAEIKALGDHE